MRVILLKTGKFRDCVFRSGLLHDLPDDLAEELLVSGWAYREGDDPPLAPDDIEVMNVVEDRQNNLWHELQLKRQARKETLEAKRIYRETIAADAQAQAAELRRNRKK